MSAEFQKSTGKTLLLHLVGAHCLVHNPDHLCQCQRWPTALQGLWYLVIASSSPGAWSEGEYQLSQLCRYPCASTKTRWKFHSWPHSEWSQKFNSGSGQQVTDPAVIHWLAKPGFTGAILAVRALTVNVKKIWLWEKKPSDLKKSDAALL